MESNGSPFGRELRHLRRSDRRCPTLRDVAKAVGVSVAYLSQLELGGRNPPNSELLMKILSFYGAEARINEFLSYAEQSQDVIRIPLNELKEPQRGPVAAFCRRLVQGDEAAYAVVELFEDQNPE